MSDLPGFFDSAAYLKPIFDEIGDKYIFEREINAGKNGITYLIRSASHGHPYCLKTVKPYIADEKERNRVKETLDKECRILKPLSHRCLPTIYESNVECELPYYICTFHPGETWNKFRRAKKTLRTEEAHFVIYSLIDAFQYLHQMGRTHCDAHEDNILISEHVFAEGILIIDFGSGHRESDPSPETPDRGHAGFKDLEGQIRFQRDVDRKSAATEFKLYDYKALGRLLALMSPVFCSNASHDQILAYREFCIILQNDSVTKDWEYVKYQFNFVVSPRFLSESTKQLFATSDGSRNCIIIPASSEIVIGDAIQKVIESAGFQRLRGIKQLSFCEWVFPGATHTRIEHSIGVFGIAKKALDFLAVDPWLKQRFTPTNMRSCLLASLIHDIGHYPFAHVIEHYVSSRYSADRELRTQVNHLAQTLKILDENEEIRTVVSTEWGGDDVIVDCKRILNGNMGVLSKIIDGTIDCDKIDYLKRDAHHCGVPYGAGFDADEVISSFRSSADGEELLVDERFVHAINGFIVAQDQMLSGVYWHERVRAIFAMFHRYLDVVIGKENYAAKLTDLVKELVACRSEASALRDVILPLSNNSKSIPATELQNLVKMHLETDEKHSYKEIARFDYVDKHDPSIRAPENIFRTIVMTTGRFGYSGPPIDWDKVRRLRGCFIEAFEQKGIKNIGPLDVIVDIAWGKGTNRMVRVIDSDRRFSPKDITSVSHLAPSFFTDPTAFSAPIRVFVPRELYHLIADERGSYIQSVIEMFFSRAEYDDEDRLK
jgi:HD superfamily phosphohydrolase